MKENDYVMFKSEKFETPEIKENVARFVKKLKENAGYIYDEKTKAVALDKEGIEKAEKTF